jgi:protein-S-isoprenylcysteine O-methyltransferase Ste14
MALVYKPGVSFLNDYPAFSWLTGFFLPHIVETTKSPLVNASRIAGYFLTFTGLLSFAICAIQVYYSKLFKKGVVTGGLYTLVRHPQYTAFAISGLGMLFVWPRYLVLIMFITLLFVYYLLAKAEESECEAKFGESYIKYKNQTNMFFPFKINIPITEKLPVTARFAIVSVFYIVLVLGSLQLAKLTKAAAVNSLYTYTDEKATYISVFEKEDEELQQLIAIANSDLAVKQFIESKNNQNTKLISYIMPGDMYISEIPMQQPEIITSHVSNPNYDESVYKIVYTKANLPETTETNTASHLINNTLSLKPFFEVRIDMKNKKITDIIELNISVVNYANMPEPVF